VTDADRLVVAAHESGHASMAWFLDHRPGAVSIRPGAHYRGITFPGQSHRRLTVDSGTFIHKPLPLWPAAERRALEIDVLVALAGEVAARPYIGVTAGPAPALSRVPAALTSGELRQIREAEGTKHQTDWERANELVDALAGESADAYLAWLRGMTEDIVRTGRFRALVDALIPVLLEHEMVGATTVRRVLAAADPENKERRPDAAAMS
jgi:hypothetical protein